MLRRQHESARSLTRTANAFRFATALTAALLLLAAVPAAAEHEQDPDPYYTGSGSAGAGYGGEQSADAYDDPVGYDGSYSYVRNLRGAATLIQADGERSQLEVNQPLLVGDRLWVSPGSMVELLLSDGNLLRLDGDSEVAFEALAYSPDVADRSTLLRLVEGNLELVVVADSLGDELPRFELPNATVYVGEAGRFRLTSDRGDWSQVVSRDGWAEVVTDAGSTVVRAGEEALVEGAGRARTVLRQAGGFDSLERWGERLDAQLARNDYVDPSLRYAAAPLDDHGTWVSVGNERAWRPRVEAGWRPYVDGRWASTPVGLTWVSAESWGWVPYHYGTWDSVPGYGWVWYPGRTFSPAWVYWYWGPSHVAWVPVGYYSHRYQRYGHGLRFGVYGWAGGSWGGFADWTFCPTRYFGDRHQRRYVHDGRYWGRQYSDRAVPRGIITTDTRGVSPRNWRDPERVTRVLRTRPAAGGAATRNGGRSLELTDVTSFVDGRRELSPEVRRRVLTTDPAVDRVAGTPLAPRTAPRTTARREGGRPGRVDSPRVARPRVDVSGSGSAASGGTSEGEGRLRVTRPRTVPQTDGAGRAGSAGPRVDRGTVDRGTLTRGNVDRGTVNRGNVDRGTVNRGTESGNAAGRDGGTGGAERRVVRPRTGPVDGASRPEAARPQTDSPNRATSPRVLRSRPVQMEGGSRTPSAAPTVRQRDDGSAQNRVSSPRVSTPPSRAPRVVRPRSSSPSSGATGAAPSTPSRSSRAGTSSEPPARRVVRGVRGTPSSPPAASRPQTARPSRDRPSGAGGAAAPRVSRPSVDRPSSARPSTAPRTSRPSTERPSAARPSAARPSTSRPSTQRPSVARPSTSRPSASRPSTSRPSASRPSTSRPSTSRPSSSSPSRSGGSAARSTSPSRSSGNRSSAGSRSGSSSRRSPSASSGSRSRSGGAAKRRGKDDG